MVMLNEVTLRLCYGCVMAAATAAASAREEAVLWLSTLSPEPSVGKRGAQRLDGGLRSHRKHRHI